MALKYSGVFLFVFLQFRFVMLFPEIHCYFPNPWGLPKVWLPQSYIYILILISIISWTDNFQLFIYLSSGYVTSKSSNKIHFCLYNKSDYFALQTSTI